MNEISDVSTWHTFAAGEWSRGTPRAKESSFPEKPDQSRRTWWDERKTSRRWQIYCWLAILYRIKKKIQRDLVQSSQLGQREENAIWERRKAVLGQCSGMGVKFQSTYKPSSEVQREKIPRGREVNIFWSSHLQRVRCVRRTTTHMNFRFVRS